MAWQSRDRQRGFTLVEVLVVILIISVLIAMLVPALRYAVYTANNFRYSADLNELERALHLYKEKYGDFPPTFADVNPGMASPLPWNMSAAYRHIKSSFPRIDPTELNLVGAYVMANNSHIDPAECLVFWLGGLSPNARQPFTGAGGPLYATGDTSQPLAWRAQERHEPLYTFDETRLRLEQSSNGSYVLGAAYLPPSKQTPYVYFDAKTYSFRDSSGSPNYAYYTHTSSQGSGTFRVVPYKSDVPKASFNASSGVDSLFLDNQFYFANRDTFQVLCAGQDDQYGPQLTSLSDMVANDANGNPVPIFTQFQSFLPYHPSYHPVNANAAFWQQQPQVYYNRGQQDNLANFSEGKTLEKARP